MKAKTCLFFFCLYFFNAYSQIKNPDQWVYSVELYAGIEGNIPQPNNYTIQLNSVGTVWASENYNIVDYFINTDPSINNSSYPWIFTIEQFYFWKGWDCVYSQNTNLPPLQAPVFGYGLYKISTNIDNSAYFYIDYRDTRIPYISMPIIGGDPIDFWIKYNYDFNVFYYSASPGEAPGNFTPITSGGYLKIWDLKLQNPTPPETEEFPNYWTNCLGITNDGYNHPRIIWGTYPNSSILLNGYKVYKKHGSAAWQLLTTVSSSVLEYTDQSVYLTPPGGQAGTYVQYKVTAVYNTNLETIPTNIAIANVQSEELEKSLVCLNTSTDKFFLDQNYPNPFNPSTKISYSIMEEGFVTLKVYNILGKEIATLVNENKAAGKYEVQFDASMLTSGIYLYRIQAINFLAIRKMILTK